MTIARLALLMGLFVVPALLLWLGHRLRDRSPAQRGAFWGGVIGHSIALPIGLLGLHYPPVLWAGDARILIAFWIMLLGGALGAAVGALRAQARR
jgi:hypothetical protein